MGFILQMYVKRKKQITIKRKIILSLFPQMYQKVKDQSVLTVENVKSVLQNEFPHADIWDILGVHSKYDNGRKAS